MVELLGRKLPSVKPLIQALKETGYHQLAMKLAQKAGVDWEAPSTSTISLLQQWESQGQSLSPLLQNFRSGLREFYLQNFKKVRLLSNDPESIFSLDEIYITLSLQHRNERSADYAKVLDPLWLDSSKVITVLKGEPGSGKTTFVHKVCFDWSQGRLPQFRFVLLLPLRALKSVDRQKGDTALELALSWLLSFIPHLKESSEEILKEMEQATGVLVILDGLDEFVPNCKELRQLMEPLPASSAAVAVCFYNTLVTTRPYKLSEVLGDHSLVAVEGFDLKQQLNYVTNFFTLSGEQAIGVVISGNLREEEELRKLASTPLILHLICRFHYTGKASQGITPLYLHMVEQLVAKAAEKLGNQSMAGWRVEQNPGWLFFTEKERFLRQMFALGRFALEKLMAEEEGALIFPKEEVSTAGIEVQLFLGISLLNQTGEKASEERRELSFPHKTFQEFLAAYALSKDEKLQNSFYDEIEQNQWKGAQMEQVLRFHCGLAEEGKSKRLESFLEKGFNLYPVECDNIVWLYNLSKEARTSTLSQRITERIEKKVKEQNTPARFAGVLIDVNIASPFSSGFYRWKDKNRHQWLLYRQKREEQFALSQAEEIKSFEFQCLSLQASLFDVQEIILNLSDKLENISRLSLEIQDANNSPQELKWPELSKVTVVSLDISKMPIAEGVTKFARGVATAAPNLVSFGVYGQREGQKIDTGLIEELPHTLQVLALYDISLSYDQQSVLVSRLPQFKDLWLLDLSNCNLKLSIPPADPEIS